jgi:hypothetical protein
MRIGLIVALVALIVAVPASAAAQQAGLRDPFDVPPAAETPATTTGVTETETGTTDVGEPVTVDSNDGIPQTGTDPHMWLAVAYLLIAVGAALVWLGRARQIPPL